MNGKSSEGTVRPVQLQELDVPAATKGSATDGGLELVEDVKVRLTISVGGTEMSIADLYALKEGELLPLDKGTNEPVDVYLGEKLVARGELMVSGENFAVRITEIGGKG
jgi:flagellar motor switch protein FliN